MKKCLLPFCVSSVMLLIGATAQAQDRGQVGLTMGLPASFGVIWHPSERLALRPELTLTHTSFESDTDLFGVRPSRDTWSVGVGASALWYFASRDSVRTYFSPRFAYGRASSEQSGSTITPTTNSVSVTAAFGAQYSPVRRFGVFGEIGYGFSHSEATLEGTIGSTRSTSRSWSTRSVAGVILYLGGN